VRRRGGRPALRARQYFVRALGFLVFVAVVGLVRDAFALHNLSVARVELTDRLSPAAITASDLMTAMLDQETGVRGYELGGEDRFLEPYRTGRHNADNALARLQTLSRQGGVSPYKPEIDAVAARSREWQSEYAEPTIARVRADPAKARQDVRADAGKARFDALRASVARLQGKLIPARESARDRLDRNARVLLFWTIFTSVVILLSVAGVARTLQSRLVGPLQALATRVRGVARGDYERSVSGEGALEVVELGTDVEAMRARIVEELAALQAAEVDLRRSNTELEQFAYVASHDLQEPLRKVASFCQLLQQRYGGQLDARADQYIGFAVDGARRMQDLINDLLAFSRVGRLEQPHTEVDCNALVARVRSDLERALEESSGRIEAGDLPTVYGDPSLLRLVFQNLCANAIKFRSDQPPVVELSAERDGDCWRFRCADNGIGIEPEYADRIFVIFQRLHARSEYEGTGIGLAMCRKIVEYHGGRMWLDVDGDRPAGSTFYFTLPARSETP
jgi:signal transduction histidine kinase